MIAALKTSIAFLSVFFSVNIERVIIILYPLIIIFALYGVKYLTFKCDGRDEVFVVFVLILFGCLFGGRDWLVIPQLLEIMILLFFLLALFISGKTNSKLQKTD